jgi:hypothetical protein
MNRNFIAGTWVMIAFAWTVAGQAITVVGTGDPKVDIPAVQAAVDQGGRVVLKGHFSFDAPPTAAETPSVLFSAAALGTVLISKAVVISGALDDQSEMTSIEGGTNPFYIEAPGAHVTIQGLHFIRPKACVIRVVAARGLVIAGNRIEGVVRDTNLIGAIAVSTSASDIPPNAGDGQPENVSGTLWIANNDIDMQATVGGNYLGIVVFAVGKSPDKEADLYVSGNKITNSNERPIDIYSVGGRAYIGRNAITTTGGMGVNVMPSGDVIHIVGPGSYLIAHNSIDCAWASGLQAGIRLQTRPGEPVSHAIVVDNDINMRAPEGTVFGVTSAAIEIRDGGEGNMVLNNRIRGRANFALSVSAQNGTPQGATFIMNDLQGFTSAQADLFVDAGGTNTIVVGGQRTVEDHGAGTVILPMHQATHACSLSRHHPQRRMLHMLEKSSVHRRKSGFGASACPAFANAGDDSRIVGSAISTQSLA